ncbi:YfiR family protein [Tunicatimonas pelagia]|uniref:YfiR family protein n=1 Tax=Tunicatimonas pelagia TaxID=931531 RepID=UPI002666FF0A|nr:YfiR family protein [Tunicatimonas pelagia]WKN45176.1 YfiR family protein [Tunicatimonas pelagia]
MSKAKRNSVVRQVKISSLVLLAVGLLCSLHVNAQISTRKLEAIYLYNFTKYINFPAASGGYVIGVLQEKSIANELQGNLKNKSEIAVKTISSPSEAKACNIVYVPKSASSQLAALVSQINDAGVLIVTEEDLASEGAPVSFVVDGSKLRFKINQLALKKTGLQASSSLLSLAILI